jgi:hypothetical protein
MKEIPVFDGLIALVDDEDYELVNQYSWGKYIGRGGTIYAKAYIKGTKSRRFVLLHRFIMGTPRDMETDHKNLNGLDCQRHNLRFATRAQNNYNRIKQRTRCSISTTSKYKGVSFDKIRSAWKARAVSNGKEIWLGRFNSELEAALAYNTFATEHYGEFARLNEILVSN